MTVSTPHYRGISRCQVLHVPRQHIYVLHPCDLNAAWHWATHKLMPGNTHTANRLLESHLGSLHIQNKMVSDI
jgi:hypothetical protein